MTEIERIQYLNEEELLLTEILKQYQTSIDRITTTLRHVKEELNEYNKEEVRVL